METINYTNLKVVHYYRKSTEAEDRQALSLGSQKDECERTASFYKLNKPVAIIEEAKSAKIAGKRPQFTGMMNDIYSKKIDTICCWHINRLARNMTEGGVIIDLLSSGQLKAIITPTEVYNQNTDVSVLSLYFGASKQYSKNLSRDVKRGQHKKAGMGVPHGVATLGFLNDKTEEKGNRKWLVDDLRLKQIKALLDMFLTGTYSAGKLHKYAVGTIKLTTVKRKRTGGKLIQLSRIYEILKDPIYAGFFFYGGERYEFDQNLPRLITEAQHNKIKGILSKANIPKTQHHQTAYSGFISSPEGNYVGQDVKFQVICDCKNKFAYRNKTTCPKCGIEIDKMKHPKYLSYAWHYNVKNKKAGIPYKSISEIDANEGMLDLVVKYLQFSEDVVAWSKKYIHEMKEKELSNKILINQQKEQRKTEFQDKKSNLRAMYRDGKFTEEEYNEDLKILNVDYLDVSETTSEGVDWYSRLMEIADITQRIASVFQGDNIEAKRKMLSSLGSNLVWNDKELNIYNDIAIEKLIEGVKRAKQLNSKFEPRNYVVKHGSKEKTEPKDPFFLLCSVGRDRTYDQAITFIPLLLMARTISSS